MSIVQKFKQLARSKEDKLLIKHNVIDDCGDLTNEGTKILQMLIFEDYKSKVVAKVEKIDQQEKKEKKK